MNLGNLETVLITQTETGSKEYFLYYKDNSYKEVKEEDLTPNELFIIELVYNISTLRTIKEVAIAETSLDNNVLYKIETIGDVLKDYTIHITRNY